MSEQSKLKVYGGNWCGTYRAIVACKSRKEFSALTGISRSYCDGPTGIAEEIKVAMAEPGAVFLQSNRDPNAAWERKQGT